MSTLPALRNKRSSDPRDKILALYGRCGSEPRLTPDCEQFPSMVFQLFTVNAVVTTGSLDMLHEVEAREGFSLIGPSLAFWAPDGPNLWNECF